nr:preprotein translocase subunit SecA [uncultured Dethiosulfovibrio sp.]
MFGSLKKALGLDPNERALKSYRKTVEEINSLESRMQSLSDDDIAVRALAIKDEFAGLDGQDLSQAMADRLPEVFAMVREASVRKLGLRHFDVQMMGGIALHQGNIAEMKTGEGKTLVAPLAVILNALSGKGVHVVTVNDYLAKRDSSWMSPLYNALGLSVGVIYSFMDPEERRRAYLSDITYGTNSEFGFDYLRDNMVLSQSQMVQRGHNYCIVDEVDSILVDEARTPLIISGPSEDSEEPYVRADQIASRLSGVAKDPNEVKPSVLDGQERPEPDGDFEFDEKERSVALTSRGIAKCEEALSIPDLFTDMAHADMAHKILQAVKARTLFKRDVHYMIKDNEIVIVDEFTGRLMFGRRFSDGLHQAIEAKEKVKIGKESQTLATITLQNYFRMYGKLAGMTGTAVTEAEEFKEIYGLGVICIPTNRPIVREDFADQVYRTKGEKFSAVADEIQNISVQGRPILVGTTSVEQSERLSKLLKARKVPHQVLNAKYHERESVIIAQAGRIGAVTVATNMAGRGTDILLGGNPEYLAQEELRKEGQEIGEAPERYQVLLKKYRESCAQEKAKVLELGGLCILGTERHEARRIDNQLRGRSGRQGDPGSSRFYLSLEDDLLRLFGSEKIQGIMGKLGLEEGEAIEHPLLTRAIESAQKKVEQLHYDIRRQLLMYDNVMNRQREAVYDERQRILTDQQVIDHGWEIVGGVAEDVIDRHFPENGELDPAGATSKLKAIFWPGVESPLEGIDNLHALPDAKEAVLSDLRSSYFLRVKQIGEDNCADLFRFISLHVLDGSWKEHLLAMDALRQGIGLRAVGQKDPLLEYQFESYSLFQESMAQVRESIAQLLFRVAVVSENRVPRRQPVRESRDFHLPSPGGSPVPGADAGDGRHEPFRREGRKIGRNEPCPCGSGKKYKACCGKNS